MTERWCWTWPRHHDYSEGPPELEAVVFVGWDVLAGWSSAHHPHEWTLTLHLPFVQLMVHRVR